MTIDALREHQAAQREEAVALGSGWASLDLVFCQEDGSPLNPHRFTDAFDRHVKAAKLPRIRLHDLRHTWATLALQQGIHPKVVSEVLGHSTIAITLDTYSHAIPTMQETAVELVAALVSADAS